MFAGAPPAVEAGTTGHSATLVSCLAASGLSIGQYNPHNTNASGYTSPTTLPATFNFAKAGTNTYTVVKGHLKPEGPTIKPGTPIVYVGYEATKSKRQGVIGSGLVEIGHFMVAWMREPQREVNVVIACVRRYGS
jgi:hypothetical protein